MLKPSFLLSSDDVPAGSQVTPSPGLQRMRMELTRRGSLGRSFDNNCAHGPGGPGVALDDGAWRAEDALVRADG